jgi:membrane complex biogenesis BtpA family protein
MAFTDLFSRPRPLIGMVHLAPLPGSPRYSGDMASILRRASRDAAILEEEGFDGIVVENFGDVPFTKGSVGPETVAAMTAVVATLTGERKFPVGVNVLRNDARAALGIAAAAGGRFIRVNVHVGVTATDQGLIEGRASETLRERARLGADIPILADVLVKHGAPIGTTDPAQAAQDAVKRGLADALLVTGAATGAEADLDSLRTVRAAVPGTPVLIASGLDPKNAAALLPDADGAIVGSALKSAGDPNRPVDRRRARRLAKAFREVR